MAPPDPLSPAATLWPLWALCLVLAGIEAVLLGADWGLWGQINWRNLAYYYGAFWGGLWQGWQANYPGQGVVMLLSYGLLHAGLWHLVFNMVTLVSLGRVALERFGTVGFWRVYGAAQIGGAVCFGALFPSNAPMVGASGALFGLAGALIWDHWDAQSRRWALLLWPSLGLLALNVVMYWSMDGQLAWQTHLGGFLSGVAVALWARPDPVP